MGPAIDFYFFCCNQFHKIPGYFLTFPRTATHLFIIIILLIFLLLHFIRNLLLAITFFQLQDYEEQTREKHTLNIHFDTSTTPRATNRDHQSGNGFVVQGGPWDQQRAAPNTASVTDFPAFGRSNDTQAAPTPIGGAWGSRR